MKPFVLAALAALILSGTPLAQDQVDVGRGENREADLAQSITDAEQFVGIAGVGNNFEIQSSQIALEKAQNSEVRAFAEMMIAEHTAMNEKLLAAMTEAALPFAPPNDIDQSSAEKMDDIRTITADQFDRTYLRWQIQTHQVSEALFAAYAEGGDNEVLKRFAAEGLPAIQQHLVRLQELNAALAQTTKPVS